MNIGELLSPWTAVALEQVPGVELFDAHTHLGQNDPDGMRQTLAELLAGLDAADARGAFVFPMHEPEGYPNANDRVIAEALGTGGGCFRSAASTRASIRSPRPNVPGRRRARDQAPPARGAVHARPPRGPQARRARRRATLPVLIHAGRGIPALGLHAVELAEAFPNARLILAHAGICDLSWIWRVAPDLPNLLFDTAWRMPADLEALFALVPPGQILFASDAPYGATAFSIAYQLRLALQAGLSAEQIRSITSEQALRIAAGEPLAPAGPPVGERERPPHLLLDRVTEFLLVSAIVTFRGGDPTEMLALARLACDVPEEIDDAPVFAALVELLDAFDGYSAEHPDDRRGRSLLILAATLARTPDVAIPAGDERLSPDFAPRSA